MHYSYSLLMGTFGACVALVSACNFIESSRLSSKIIQMLVFGLNLFAAMYYACKAAMQ